MNAESAQTTALLIDGVEQHITTVAESAAGSVWASMTKTIG